MIDGMKTGSKGDGNYLSLIKPEDYGWKGLNRMPTTARCSTVVIGEALQEAGSRDLGVYKEETALIVGCSYGHLEAISSMFDEANKFGVTNVNPSLFPNTVINVIGGHASAYFKLQGPNVTISQGRYTALKSLIYGIDLLRRGSVRRCVVCIADVLPPERFHPFAGDLPEREQITAFVLDHNPVYTHQSLEFDFQHRGIEEVAQSPQPYNNTIQPEDITCMLPQLYSLIKNDLQNSACCGIDAGREGQFSVKIQVDSSHEK